LALEGGPFLLEFSQFTLFALQVAAAVEATEAAAVVLVELSKTITIR